MRFNRITFLMVYTTTALLLISLGLLALVLPPSPSTPLGVGITVLGILFILHAAYRVGQALPLLLVSGVLWLASDLVVRYANPQAPSFMTIAVISFVLQGASLVCGVTASILFFKYGLEKYK